MFIKLIWSNMTFKAIISLLIFCLGDLPIDMGGEDDGGGEDWMWKVGSG